MESNRRNSHSKATVASNQANDRSSAVRTTHSYESDTAARSLEALASAVFLIGRNADSDTAEDRDLKSSLSEGLHEAEACCGAIRHILARCYLSGCDCHLMDRGGVSQHFKNGAPLEAELARLRNILKGAPESVIAVVLYDDMRIELMHLDGKSEAA